MKKLNNKKGFTLVELIVVIAIIGVLAAILIPTMIGYVTRSYVTNANATASKLRDSVTYFLTEANANDYGMFKSETAVCDVDITVTNSLWSITLTDNSVFICHGGMTWPSTGVGQKDDSMATTDATSRLAIYLAESFRDIKDAHIEFKLVGGVCVALYITTDTTNEISGIPEFGNGTPWDVESYHWDYQNQGVTLEGYVVGTSPVIPMGV